MAVTKPVLIGRDLQIYVAPATIAADTGEITIGSEGALVGVAKRVTFRGDPRTFEANALDAWIVNNVRYLDNWTLTVSAIKLRRTSSDDLLESLFLTGDTPPERVEYAQVRVVRANRVLTFLGAISGYNWDVVPEENIEEITVIPIDLGSETRNPSWVAV